MAPEAEWSIWSGTQETDSDQIAQTSLSSETWGLYAGLGSERPSSRAIVPADYEPIRDPTLSESFFKIVIAKQLTRVPVGQDRSKIDRQQEKLIDGLNWALNKVGQEGNVELPFRANIEETFDGITRQYLNVLPEGVSTPTEIDRDVDHQTRSMIVRLEQGRLDQDYDVTDDERHAAMLIREKIGEVPPAELRNIFAESIYGRASDITRAQNGNRLAYFQQDLSNGLRRLQHHEPDRWFSVDLLTNILMLTPDERKKMQNIIWTVTPNNIHIRDINRIGEDFRRYPLSDMARGGQGIIVLPGTVDYVDRVRRVGGPLFQPAINKWARADIGGLILLRTLERDTPAAKFVVREPVTTAAGLREIGGVAREVEDLNEMMTDAVRNPEAAMRFPIRPNKVRELLPDPIVFQLGVIAHPNGEIDYGPAIRELEQRKIDLQTTLRAMAVKAAVELDEEGNPPIETQRAMRSITGAIEKTENTQHRLQAKNLNQENNE